MGLEGVSAIAVILAVMAIVICGGLAVYHFLVFDNIDGVAQDLDFYNYDEGSKHFLYWFGFWMIILFGGILTTAKANTKG